MRLELGFLASHNGTDMRAIAEAVEKNELNARTKIVISNNKSSPALAYAREHNIAAIHINDKTHKYPDLAIRDALLAYNVNLVVMSGYMKKVEQETRNSFKNRILNVHPALLPKYGGIYGDSVHEAVLASNDEFTGPTIHLIDAEYDTGPLIAQSKVKIKPNDTVYSLKNRVQEAEISLYLKVLSDLASETLDLDKL